MIHRPGLAFIFSLNRTQIYTDSFVQRITSLPPGRQSPLSPVFCPLAQLPPPFLAFLAFPATILLTTDYWLLTGRQALGLTPYALGLTPHHSPAACRNSSAKSVFSQVKNSKVLLPIFFLNGSRPK